MLELNKVLLVGNLTRDPEYRATTTGRAVAKLGLAVSRRMGVNRETGESNEETLFIDVTAWERTAEFCKNYLSKGRRIFVEGRLRQETWQDKETGANRSKILVVADRIQFADAKPVGGGGAPSDAREDNSGGEPDWEAGGGRSAQGGGRPAAPAGESTNDDLPF